MRSNQRMEEKNEELMLINGNLVRRINRRERIASENLKLKAEIKQLKKEIEELKKTGRKFDFNYQNNPLT